MKHRHFVTELKSAEWTEVLTGIWFSVSAQSLYMFIFILLP